jgi:hypothetical protein
MKEIIEAFIRIVRELRAWVQRRPDLDRLRGDWDCEWDVTFPRGKAETYHDVVTFERISAEHIRATGRTPGVGSYRLSGRLSEASLVTFYYQGISDLKRTLGGVVILELNANWNTLAGYWYEYTSDRKMIGGRTRWTKATG